MNRWTCLRGHGVFETAALASKRGELACPVCLSGGTLTTSTLRSSELCEFPIHSARRVSALPWEMIQPHGRRLMLNFGSTLSEMVLRGGLSPCEAVAVLRDEPWVALSQAEAETALEGLIADWRAR